MTLAALALKSSFSFRSLITHVHNGAATLRMESSNVIATTVGILIGYFAGEVTKAKAFDRLLWVHRYFYAIDPISLVRAALFMPIGGVLHKATLEALDQLHARGLMTLKSARGHMLGSSFFRDSGYKYQVAVEGDIVEEARNGFLISILEFCSRNYEPPKGIHKEKNKSSRSRSVQSLCVLELACQPVDPKKTQLLSINLSVETNPTSIRPLASMFAS